MWWRLAPAYFLLTAVLTGWSEGTPSFIYTIPQFSNATGSELILSSLSRGPVDANIRVLGARGAQLSSVDVVIEAGFQSRLIPASFGGAAGTLIVTSSGPLSVAATVVEPGGAFDNVGPSTDSDYLVVPVATGTPRRMDLTLFNPDSVPASAFFQAVGPDGITVSVAQRLVPAFGRITESVSAIFPSPASGRSGEISHLVIRALTNVLSPSHRLHVQASFREFPDPAIMSAVVPGAARSNPVLPFFIQGGDFETTIQVVNASDATNSVAIMGFRADGQLLSVGSAFSLPPNGSIRATVESLLNTGSGVVTGSIAFMSDAPIHVIEGIADKVRGAFVLVSPSPADTNFAFSRKSANAGLFTSLALLNPNSTEARVQVRSISDDASSVTQASLTLGPYASTARMISEILPQPGNAGFVYISADVPIAAFAFESGSNNTLLANLPLMHSQPDYDPPSQTQFQISGTVRLGANAMPGVQIRLSGPVVLSTLTDRSGMYQFANVPRGPYTIEAAATGYAVVQSPRTVTLTNEDSTANDFDAILTTLTINDVQPTTIVTGSSDTRVTINGGPFDVAVDIVFDGVALPTTRTATSPPALQAVIPAARLVSARIASLLLRANVGGATVWSSSATIAVTNPAPVLSTLENVPQPLRAGNPGFTLTVTGSGFRSRLTISVDGAARPTTLVNETSARIDITAADLAQSATLTITARNASPSLGPSNALTLNVIPPAAPTGPPVMLSISPSTTDVRLTANAPPLALTATGSNFMAGATIFVNNAAVPTEFVSSTTLIGSVPVSALQQAGTLQVSVRNPEPGIPPSASLPLLVNNPLPILSSLETGSLKFDPIGPPVTIKLHGSNFAPSSTFDLVSPCGAVFLTERISPQLAEMTISFQCAGTYGVFVRTLPPGGGTSQTLSFVVN